MRAKRSKKYRKLMQQYELTFGFREPYQVLVDSNFLRAVYSFKMDLVPALERTLHGKVKPFITKCSLAAVMASSSTQQQQQQSKFVPNTRPPQLPPPTTLPLRYCSHNEDSKTIDEVDCLLSLLSPNPELKKNKEHYILATADPEPTNTHTQKWKSIAATAPEPPTNYLRKGARQIPGVPIIYVKRSVMVLEPLSNSSEGVREGVERGKLKTGITKTVAGKRKRDDADEGEGKDTSTGTKEKKPKRAKGPNPLSVKKPKNHAKPSNSSRGGGGSGGEKNEDNKPAEAKQQPAHASEDENVKDKSNAGGEPTGKTKRKRRHKSHKSDNSQEAGLPQLGAPLAVEL
ncbi:rRNA processing protein [Histoplasma capsulatum var. duboisii H88]|uniref:rRNA processing protein n=1 Tax=Ajellomyces capsulatus (strain H88) TaxID=544711 RepID=A0A8A1LR84_AJEC8|nr:rRNA processing protein [Histoplasma capsulatum var. duboisii H88]